MKTVNLRCNIPMKKKISEKRITIRDVAKAAGVSIATVSRVINGQNDKAFPTETRKHVWTVAHQMGYEPNQQARRLRSGIRSSRTKTNLIMRIFNRGGEEVLGKRALADNVQTFDWAANQYGFFTTNYHYYHEEGFRCPLLLDDLIDGVVIGVPHKDIVRIVSEKVPTVLLDVGSGGIGTDLPRVNSATAEGLMEILSLAKELGHHSLAIVGGPPVANDNFLRNYFQMIRNCADELGYVLSPQYTFQAENINDGNHDEMMHEIALLLEPEIRNGSVSLIAGEDMVYSASLYKELTSMGIKIPEDVSLISVNSIGFEDEISGKITSVAHNWIQLCKSAIEVLKDTIDGKILCSEFLVAPRINRGTTLDKVKLHNKKEKIK